MTEHEAPVGVVDQPPPQARRSHPGRARRVLAAIPPLAVFAALGGLLYWGHRTGWSVPAFASLTGSGTRPADDWCPDHGVPESACVECDPALLPRPRARGWCEAHGVHECPLCHPELAQLPTPPAVTPADRDRAARALAFADRPENDPACPLHRRRVQFASAAAADRAGVGVEPVWTAPVVESVAGPGELAHDPTRIARLSSRAPGTVFRADKRVGDPVRAGEVVALVDAAEVGRAKAEFLQSLVAVRLLVVTVERLRLTETSGSGSPQRRAEAEARLTETRIRLATAQQALTNLGLPVRAEDFEAVPDDQLAGRLRFLGLPKGLADTFDPATTTGNLLPVVAPLGGAVTARDVVPGEVVDAARVLFVVADTRRVWLTLDLRLEDAGRVAVGQKVVFRPDGANADAVGAVEWVSPEADHRTRTVKVRATLPNDDGRLRANTFGAGRVVLREEKTAVVVPSGAVHWEGCCHVVFVRDRDYLKPDAPKVFHTRSVRPGARDGANTEIVAGVLPGELVAAKGSAALRAELLRGKMGEG